jgi:Flp pilus assembly protein TadG
MQHTRKLLAFGRTIAGDRTGFGAMELGLALPFLVLLSLGMVDASKLISTKIDYEQAAQRTTDFALAKRPNGSDGTYLKTEAANAAGVASENVSVSIFLECNGVQQQDFDASCAAGEIPARFAEVTISSPVATEFDWSGIARILGVKAFDNQVIVTGDSLVRFQ